ncbi:MAG: porin [Pseudomonadota bacterium]
MNFLERKVVFTLLIILFFLSGRFYPALASSEVSLQERIEKLEKIMQDQQRSLESLKSELENQKAAEETNRQDQEKLSTLEKKVEAVESVKTKMEQEDAKLQTDKKKRAIAYWQDGFNIETPDQQFRLNMAGVLQLDYRQFSSDRSASSFDIRRARYDMRGSLYRDEFEHLFRLQIEMADEPYLRNAYWMFKFRPEFNFQLGQFKVPAGGADFLTEEAQINFIEYATETPVSPFFDRGINIHSFFLNGKVQTNLAVVTGVGVDRDVGQGDYDNHKDYAGRLLFIPFKDTAIPWLKGVHFGGSFQDGLQTIKTKRGETSNRTENYESLWFRWTKDYVDLEERKRYGGEVHWLYGPFSMSYEFNRVQWEDITVYKEVYTTVPTVGGSIAKTQRVFDFCLPDEYHADVHQVWVSYFLTGEEKQFQDIFFAWRQPKPKQNFSLKQGTWGAWEILARYSYKDASEELFNSGILEGSRSGYSVTGGLRWIWNPKVRLMLDVNYLKSAEGKGIIVERTDKGASPSRSYKDSETAVLMRFILTP